MTQEQNHRSSTSKRTARPARNRPVLVTSPTPTDSSTDDPTEQVSNDTSHPAEAQADTRAPSLLNPTPAPTGTRKLAGFFSRVGKSTQVETPEAEGASELKDAPQADAINRAPTAARLARATRGKAGLPGRAGASPAPTVSDKKSEASEPVKVSEPVSARSAPARPRSGFKMRYILGLAIYLLGAQLIGAYESAFLTTNHLDNVLFTIGPIAIRTSTLVFLATLIILLVILARFDLIPRNLGAMMGQPTPSRRAGSTQSQKTQENVKTPPPTMKQGVKGGDDDLYQEYREQRRYQQRRDRKR